MLILASFRVSSRLMMNASSRFYSTKLTYAPKVCSQEFCLDNYDSIGFDLDHTICTYKLRPLMNLIYRTLTSFLIKKHNYPLSLSNLSDGQLSFAQKGILLDKSRGNFLKLDNQFKIIKATHGTKLLSEEEIVHVYGRNMIVEEAKGVPRKLVADTAIKEPFYVFKDYFVTVGAVVCANIVDALDGKNGKPLDRYEFWDHYVEGLYYMYDRTNFKMNNGEIYPELKGNPHMYINPCSGAVKNWIRSISKEKVTFLLTSSNYDSAAFLAEYSLGKDWKSYFDVIVTFARKPGFFWKDRPFCMVSEDGETSIQPQDIKTNLVYSQGNWKHLQEVCSKLSKAPQPKVLYFGDSLIEDVFASSELAQCDSVAVVEELIAEGMENVSDLHEDAEVLNSVFWGSFFAHKKLGRSDESKMTLWGYLLSQHSKLTIPNLESMVNVGLRDKLPCFSPETPLSGFFPNVPKSLSSV